MGRSRLGVLTALALSLAGRAGAAEITNVATRGGPGKAFDLRVTLRWDRTQERAQIEREVPSLPSAENPAGGAMGDELRYTRTENRVVPRVALALAEDLEVHFEWPYVLGDDRTWRFGLPVAGVPTGGTPSSLSTIELNDVTPDGTTPCTGVDAFPGIAGVQCPLFPVAPQQTIFHGGRAGDLKGGIAWGIFDDKEDPTKPFWLVGLDITFPTAARYDPATGRSADWVSASSAPGHPAPVGEKVWKWDFQTVLSRRLGPMDPYVKGHVMFLTKSSSTYSNCEHATELAGTQMLTTAPASCQAQGTKAGAKLPWNAGITVGTELVPYENEQEQQRVAIDFRLFGEYTSSARFYNELTDMNGKLNWTEDYLTAGGLLGLYLRASRYVTLQASASVSTSTPHWLTGESLDGGTNPNFDWRYDAPGRRFRISEVANFAMSFAGVLTF